MNRIGMIVIITLFTSFLSVNAQHYGNRYDDRHESRYGQHDSERNQTDAKRIVVADYGALDTIAALNEEARVVGLPKAALPHYLQQFADESYENIGGLKSLDIAKIRDLKPDLIIISGRQEGFYDALDEIAPTMRYHFRHRHYGKSLKRNIMHIGSLLGKEDKARESLTALREIIKESNKITEKSDLKAVVILHNDEKLFASSTNRIAHFVHQLLGVKAADEALSERSEIVTTLYLNKTDPDIIYVIDRSGIIGREPFDKNYFNNESIQSIKAIKNNRVIYLTSDLWYFGGDGLGSIPLQIEEVLAPFKAEIGENSMDEVDEESAGQ